jgi:hypothetical protein
MQANCKKKFQRQSDLEISCRVDMVVNIVKKGCAVAPIEVRLS